MLLRRDASRFKNSRAGDASDSQGPRTTWNKIPSKKLLRSRKKHEFYYTVANGFFPEKEPVAILGKALVRVTVTGTWHSGKLQDFPHRRVE